MISQQDLRFSRITSLLNYAVRVRSANYRHSAATYASVLKEIEDSIEDSGLHTAQTVWAHQPESSRPHSSGAQTSTSQASQRLPKINELPLKSSLKFQLPWARPLKTENPLEETKAMDEVSEKSEEENCEEASEEPHEAGAENVQPSEADRREEVLRRYEKTFGKARLMKVLPPAPQSETSSVRSESRRRAVARLKALEQKEQKIIQEKQELTRLIELKSNTSRTASRPATVYSVTRQSKPSNPYIRRRASVSQPEVFLTAVDASKPPSQQLRSQDEVSDLLRAL